ncbi:MAG: hypothetical protein ABJC10_05350 [Acidobacteriota bacterium]
MKRLLVSLGLVFVLGSFAFAGEIPSVGAPAPPPSGSSQIKSAAPGDIPSGGQAEISSEALSALLSALSYLV